MKIGTYNSYFKVQKYHQLISTLKILFFLSICIYCIPQYKCITLDFGEQGTLERTSEQLAWSEFMLIRMENFKNFRSPGIIELEKFITKDNFKLLEEFINSNDMEMNITLTEALILLSSIEPFLILESHRLLFIQNLAGTVLSSENFHVLETETQLEERNLHPFIVLFLECLCTDNRIPISIRYEANVAMISMKEDIPGINKFNLSDIQSKNIKEIHVHISLSILHFLTKGPWSAYTSAKMFRVFYESNEVTKRIVDFDHAEFDSSPWCYESLFENATIDTFKMRINKMNIKWLYSMHDCLRKHLKVINLQVYTKDYNNLSIENICNTEFLNTLEISLENNDYFSAFHISFSKFTLKKCTILSLNNVNLDENSYETLLRMENLTKLNICSVGASDTNLTMKIWKNEKIMKILNVVDLEKSYRSLSTFLDSVQTSTICPIKRLCIVIYDDERLSNNLLNIFQNESLKNSLQKIKLRTDELTNILCNAILGCKDLEDVNLEIEHCSEPLTKISYFPCYSTLKFIHIKIESCSSEFTCSAFDDFKNTEVFGFEIVVRSETMNFCNNSNVMISKITTLEIEIFDSNNYDLKWIDHALNVTELNINYRKYSDHQDIIKILKVKIFAERLKILTLYMPKIPQNELYVLSDLIKRFQRLEVLEWTVLQYNIDCLTTFFRNEWIKTLKVLKLALYKDNNFFESLTEPLESMLTLRLRISSGVVFNENYGSMKKYFPALKNLDVSSYDKNHGFLKITIMFIRTFNFVENICFTHENLNSIDKSNIADFIVKEKQRPTIVKIKGSLRNFEAIVIFRDEYKISLSSRNNTNRIFSALNYVFSRVKLYFTYDGPN